VALCSGLIWRHCHEASALSVLSMWFAVIATTLFL